LQDVFVAKLDPTGAVLWSKSFGNVEIQAANGLAVDGNGDVIITGYFRGTINFGGTNLTTSSSRGSFRFATVSLDRSSKTVAGLPTAWVPWERPFRPFL
jgi:hypothetical protein